MALEHGQQAKGRLLAKLDANSFVYDPSFYKEPKVYEKERRRALLVIDMLDDFVYGSLRCERILPKLENIAELADKCRANSVPVIYCNDSHKPTDFELRRWEPHAMRGTKGAEVIKPLRPRTSDYIVPKSTYSSFHDTELDDILRSLYYGKGANTIVLTGLHTDCCLRHTTADAFFRRYEAEIIDDGSDAFSEVQHRVGLQYMRYWYLADVRTTNEVIRVL
jgi:nicotinamidase-related amidase